jgi:hypothetical protein
MNWNRVEFCYGQRLELRACDHAASRWVPVSVCGVLVAPSKDPHEPQVTYQVVEASGRTTWVGRDRLRTIFENSENSLLTDRQIADSIHAPDARATE